VSVESTITSYLNYITGSAGGQWPEFSCAGILTSVDYVIESGSNETKLYEMNVNIEIDGNLSDRVSRFDKIAEYASSQSFIDAKVYSVYPLQTIMTPTDINKNLLSSSFAKSNISCSFSGFRSVVTPSAEPFYTSSYFEQVGIEESSDTFHLFLGGLYWATDSLYTLTSGSFDKNEFRDILSASPVSSSLIPLFDSSSYTSNSNFPDYVVKDSLLDNSLLSSNTIGFYNFVSTGSYHLGDIVEKFIIGSGSYYNEKSYMSSGKQIYLMTPEKNILLSDYYAPHKVRLTKGSTDVGIWQWGGGKNHEIGYTTASGSLITMYDESTKQIQDVEVGDVVKSYQPIGLPDESSGNPYASYSTTDLSGSFASGSVVIDIYSEEVPSYWLANNSIKYTYQSHHFVKKDDTWSFSLDIEVGNSLLDKDGNEVEITSISEVLESETFYSLNVEDIDTYFQSEILVHNLPPK
jgi:hypothetical protein